MITDQKELVFLSQLNIIQIDIRKKKQKHYEPNNRPMLKTIKLL